MTVTTVERLQQCSTPKEALLMLAEAIDALGSKPEPDLWEAHLDWAPKDNPKAHHFTTPTVTPDNRSRIVDGEVVVGPVSPARQFGREAFARQHRLQEFYGDGLNEEDFGKAYSKGGPRWLYYTNRDCIMQMPMELRRALVADVELDSPSEAGEISRDICKQEESVPEGTQIEYLRRALGPVAP